MTDSRTLTLEDFLDRFEVNTETLCWEWTGALDSNGYGRLGTKKVHRISYELWIGPIPKGYFVCHHCDNIVCINPDHLFAGTNQDNIRDASRKGRLSCGEDRWSAVLTEANVREVRASSESSTILGRRLGVDKSTINKVRTGRTWAHVN